MQKHDKALVGFPQEDRTNVHGSSIYGASAVLKNQQHSWQRSSPRMPWRPSRAMMGVMIRAAKGSAHHQPKAFAAKIARSEEHTSELQSPDHLVCRLLLEKKKDKKATS